MLRAFAAILASALIAVNAGTVLAQSGFAQGAQSGSILGGTLFGDQPQLFANDGRVRLLVLGLNPFGLTESASEQIGLILQKNLVNTGHFDVVGPREINAALEKGQPELVDCREIACGVESGKVVGAQRVLVGTLRLADPNFVLTVRVIDTSNNLTDYEEEIHFTDESMDEDLFRLANNVSRNSLLQGRVLSTSIRGIVISIGKTNGIELGDHLVIYKREVPITDLDGQQIDTQRKNVAIVKVLNVNENSSEAILVHKTEEPQVGQYALTYQDPQRQIALIEHTRKELDTGIRLANRIRPLELAPVLLADGDRKEWMRSLSKAEEEQKKWYTVMIAGGVVTLLVLNNWSGTSTDLLLLAGAGGAGGYGFWKWREGRDAVDQIKAEGSSKGYLSFSTTPFLLPGGGGVQLALRF